jgi:phosphohistidine phosphatase SixA
MILIKVNATAERATPAYMRKGSNMQHHLPVSHHPLSSLLLVKLLNRVEGPTELESATAWCLKSQGSSAAIDQQNLCNRTVCVLASLAWLAAAHLTLSGTLHT